MTQSLPSPTYNASLLTATAVVLFYSTRWLIIVLSFVGVACTLSDQYIHYAWLFCMVCPMGANAIWWIKCLSLRSRNSTSTQPLSSSPWLAGPCFWLPIADHIAFLSIPSVQKRRLGNEEQTPVRDGETSSLIQPAGKIRSLFEGLQNNVVVALITTCCQVYSIAAYMS